MKRGTVVGVDIGGTRIKAVLLEGDTVTHRIVLPSPQDLPIRFAEVVESVVVAVLAGTSTPATRVGVVVPGLVDDATGRALWSANLGWRDLDVQGLVADRLGIPTIGGHDVRAGLIGEHRFGAAVGVDDVLFMPLGTGLASALMIGGRVVSGSPWTGEIGHVRVRADGPLCGCGRSGCLEAIASAGAIGRRWTEVTGHSGDAQDVAALVLTGDPLACAIWQDAVDALAVACAPIVAAVGTRRVVAGGGLVEAGDVLVTPLREAFAARLPDELEVEVVAAALGEWAGAIGAACLARDGRS